jgi:bacterioferritin
MKKNQFISDIAIIRERARKHIEDGPVTETYTADRQTVLNLLNEALATELVCVLRYKYHHFMVKGINAESIGQEFLEHAKEEEEHADRIAARIVQLGGSPEFNPDALTKHSHSEYVQGQTALEMITEDLVAERIAIDSYREIIKYIGDSDSTTRRLLEEILENEEEHAEDLSSMLSRYDDQEHNGKNRSTKRV